MKRPVGVSILSFLFGVLAILKTIGLVMLSGQTSVKIPANVMFVDVVSIPLYIALCIGFFLGKSWARTLYLAAGVLALLVGVAFNSGKGTGSSGDAMVLVLVRGVFLAAVAYYLYRPGRNDYFSNKTNVGSEQGGQSA